jgi:hypothetical protein
MAIGYGYVAPAFGGSSGGRKTLRYKSRPIYTTPNKTDFTEVLSVKLLVTYNDEHQFSVTLRLDGRRLKCEVAAAALSVENSRLAADYYLFRTFLDVVPEEGGIGTFLSVEIAKTLHVSNLFRFSGMNVYALSRAGLASEFLAGGLIANG